jgi:glutamate-1-semialdehyde 2,1-aminomutase
MRGDGVGSGIEAIYRSRTPGSAELMARAANCMPAGNTRSLSWFAPYPVVFESGSGAELVDVDGNRYLDFMINGLSLVHGHAYPPVMDALGRAMERGTAWPGASDAQIEFAELLCGRVESGDQVRFTNTGTEATMLSVKLARAVTGRQVVVKAIGGYHGSFDDLEAGLHGRGELPGRVALAEFGDVSSFADALERHEGQVAAVIIEPVMYTDPVVSPPEGFLPEIERLTREAGALFILDDCLMFRLAEGGSAELFGLSPDITALGKWIGGGLPTGAIVASRELMALFDPHRPDALYHGGSFNGNLLSCVAGSIAVAHLTAERIDTMNAKAARITARLEAEGAKLGLPVSIRGEGAALGVYIGAGDGAIDWRLTRLLHLAGTTRGVYLGTGGELALSTAITDDQVGHACDALAAALCDVAEEMAASGRREREESVT